MDGCVFCKIFATEIMPGKFEKHFWWRLDIHPVSPGHMLIIPKRHVATLDELTAEEEANLREARWQATQFIEALGQQRMRPLYELMIKRPATPNSAWFARRALDHSHFGTKPDGYNHAVNEGAVAGQTVMHLHWHVIPRYSGDVEDPRGGVRYVIPEMGNYTTLRS